MNCPKNQSGICVGGSYDGKRITPGTCLLVCAVTWEGKAELTAAHRESVAKAPPIPTPIRPDPTPEQAALADDLSGMDQALRSGLGSEVEAWAKKIGADRAARAFEYTTGIGCGCVWRKRMLNKLAPGGWRSLLGMAGA